MYLKWSKKTVISICFYYALNINISIKYYMKNYDMVNIRYPIRQFRFRSFINNEQDVVSECGVGRTPLDMSKFY